MNLRISESHWRDVQRATMSSFSKALGRPAETGCILLCGHNAHSVRPSLLVADVLIPSDQDLKDQEYGGLTFSSSYLRRALLTVRQRGLKGFLTLHTHPLADRYVGFSNYDNENDPQLMQNLYEMQQDGLFGSIVIGKNSAAARIWDCSRFLPLRNLVIVGEQLCFIPLNGDSSTIAVPEASEIFDRSLALTGQGALSILSQLRIAVIGASGTGSLIVELLARAGAGEIVLFDFDTADHTNLNRVLYLRTRDTDVKRIKAERLAEAIKESGLPSRITIVKDGDIRKPEVASELRGCDLLIGCVDRDWPRLILSEVSYQYLLPYLDLGTEIGISDDCIQSIDSRTSYVCPGRPCLLCSKVVSQERLRLETLESDEQDRVIKMGYSADIRLKAPAVMELNMRSASLAMFLLRNLLQPFLAAPVPHTIKEALTNYSTRQLFYSVMPKCPCCDSERLGAGGSSRLSTRPQA